MTRSLLFAAALAAVVTSSPRQPAELRVLFVGNSLTEANDLPAMVERIVRSSGWQGRVTSERVTQAGVGLGDHWEQGDARRAIRRGRWTHVVLQQGPSSLADSRAHLRKYAALFAREIRASGAEVVLYGVWPPRDRLAFLPDVTESYRQAARDADGRLVPVGEAWAAAWKRDPSLALYGADQFHPSLAGTYLAAVVFAEALTGHPLDTLTASAKRALAPPGAALSDAQLETVHAAATFVRQEGRPGRTMAITIDDLPTVSALGNDLPRAGRITRDLLAALGRAGVPAIGFVNEQKLQPAGAPEPERIALLQQWIDAGFDLGNHTFSHPDLHQVAPAAYEADIVRGEAVTRRLMEGAGRKLRYFRHPFLRTGRSAEVRNRIAAFLASRGYTVAPVTIDNSDYVFAAAYERALGAGDDALAARIADTYATYMLAVVEYYEAQSELIVGRPVAHTLLIHASALNAVTIERIVERLEGRGYGFVTLEEALTDPAYGSNDEYHGPGGISWLHRWALTVGRKGIFAGEPAVPDWIAKAAGG